MKRLLFAFAALLLLASCGGKDEITIHGTWQLVQTSITDGTTTETDDITVEDNILRMYADGTGWVYSSEMEMGGDFDYVYADGTLTVTIVDQVPLPPFHVDTLTAKEMTLSAKATKKGVELTYSFKFKKIPSMRKEEYNEKFGK
jgi:hypothetical protein